MSETEETKKNNGEITLEGGTYEIIRTRLLNHGNELRARMDKLNNARKDIFGAIEQTLLATERITTRNNCIARDMVPINGNQFLFGYNVQMGLKSEIQITDVFAVYEYKDHTFAKLAWDILNSGQFEEDLKNLYKYYKATRFSKFSVLGPHLFMVFRVGKSPSDIKTFKWLSQDGNLTYLDNRSDHEFKFPAQHDFKWERTPRDWHRSGKYPHISIKDRVFVEAVGGDITFKVEDNTETGQGIYAEEVENPDQTLDDAEIHYSILGHIILVRIKPYQENKFRYFIFNQKTVEVVRVDEIEQACVLLPDDHGLIFSNGYYLQTGELKKFDLGISDMVFEKRVASPNGEDFLYSFYNHDLGDYILLSYNLIEQKVETPIYCNGYSHFENGELIFFRSDKEPTRNHVIQIWQTPYVGGDFAFSKKSDAFLYKVGNPDIVRCMAECNELLKLMNREEPYSGLYVDLMKKAAEVAETYFWIDKPDAFNLKETVLQIKNAAAGAIEEFEKVVRLKKNAEDETAGIQAKTREILSSIAPEQMESIDEFVKKLADLRTLRGEIITLKELRYVNLDAVDRMDKDVSEQTDRLSGLCVEFLLKPESLTPYETRVDKAGEQIDDLAKVTEAQELEEMVSTSSQELEMLIEIVSNLKIDDATQTTRIIDNISAIYSRLNQVKSSLKNKKKSLQSVEGTAQFNAQVKLLNQSVINYLDICETPDKCDEYLTKVMVSLEEIEGRFADFDDFIVQLSEKRDEIYNAFESKKLNLTEARNKRASALMSAAERILKGVQNRVSGMDDISAINGYFASDLMISKIRDIVDRLLELDDTVKADDIQSRLKTVREDTVRQLKDRKELFVDGANIIKFGEHRFTVNVQALDLTVVMRDGQQMFHLTGTDFFEPITDEEFLSTKAIWDMEVVSEDKEVYRAEYLAFQMLKELEKSDKNSKDETLEKFKIFTDGEWPENEWIDHVQKFMGPRYVEGYSKGIHDHDGAKIFKNLVNMHTSIGLLRFHPKTRALARLFWHIYFKTQSDEKLQTLISDKLMGFGIMAELFPGQNNQESYIAELEALIFDFSEKTKLFPGTPAKNAARYLFHELTTHEGDKFVISKEAWELAENFIKHLKSTRFADKFKEAREKLGSFPSEEFELVRDWVKGYSDSFDKGNSDDYIAESSVLIFCRNSQRRFVIDVATSLEIKGMAGSHKVIQDKKYHLNYNQFTEKLAGYEQETVPLFIKYGETKKKLTERMREEMRLDEFKPRVLSSFVRNRLINQVYLPLVGDNLAKQIGVAGEAKRTDLMGLLLLISPPGYGKTTLMEYLANRLGIIFMKINGPAIGHNVTSLDPSEAPNASAREEMLKLNLALEMGDNVMLYLDDIQHCNPELLQKFISLCDAQRKIEGVYKGKSRTYDLRGKKVVVVMAGNPYTESGDKFKIPDMLANRADTYNLGDIIGDTAEAFKMSYLENCLTSNAVLNKLSSKSQKDVYAIIRIAETGTRDGAEFEGSYSVEEINEMVSVMKKLITLREVILKVNLEYINSAGQADEYRTEPPFKLQGSYRNMNRLAEKIVPIMNPEELKTLILSHYEQESQTLTTGAEANLLKFKEITGWMDKKEQNRWNDIKKTFKKNLMLRGMDASDPVTQIVGQLSAFYDGLESIREVLARGRNEEATQIAFSSETVESLKTVVSEQLSVITSHLASAKDKEPAMPSTLQVNSQIPDGFLNILEAQIDLMSSWMEPIFKSGMYQANGIQKLSRDIQNLKSVYREVIQLKGESDWQNIEKYDIALKINPQDDKTYYKRGLAWYNKNEFARALHDFNNALDLKPKNKKYQRIVAHLKAEMTSDKIDEAEEL